MVIGIIRDADRSLREQMENHLAEDLSSMGFPAYSSLAVYGPEGFTGMDSLAAYTKLMNDHVDAVLTITLLDKKKEKYYVPGKAAYAPYASHQARFWNYYSTMSGRIEGAYFEVSTKYFWESNFYSLQNRELLFSLQTKAFDPVSTRQLGHEYGQVIANTLVKNELLLRKNSPTKVL
jgi:hypothetical protein